VQFFITHGLGAACHQHVLDGGCDTTHIIKVGDTMKETFHLGQDMLWSREAFTQAYKSDPETAGYKHFKKNLPDGQVLSGYRTPDSGLRPLPKGVLLISKDVETVVGIEETHKADPNDDAACSVSDRMQMLARRHFGKDSSSSPSTSSAPIALDTLAQMAARGGTLSGPATQPKGSATEQVDGAEAAAWSIDDPKNPIIESPTAKATSPGQAMVVPSTPGPISSPAPRAASLDEALRKLDGENAAGDNCQHQAKSAGVQSAKASNKAGVAVVPAAAKPAKVLKTAVVKKGKGGAVLKILPEAEKELQLMKEEFINCTTVEQTDAFSESAQKIGTKWGKKKGALLSCHMEDAAESLIELKETLTKMCKLVTAHVNFVSDMSKANAHMYMVAWTTWTDTNPGLPHDGIVPEMMVVQRRMAGALEHWNGGNFTSAFSEIRFTDYKDLLSDDAATEEQTKFFKRCYTEMLQVCDTQKLNDDDTLFKIMPLTQAICDTNDHDNMFMPDFHNVTTKVMDVLQPHTATKDTCFCFNKDTAQQQIKTKT